MKTSIQSTFVCFALLVVAFCSTDVCVGQQVVPQYVPGELANIEGNSLLNEPFSFAGAGAGSLRVQQVYAASEFIAGVAPEGGWISGLSFRADGSNNRNTGYHADIPSLQITLSVTARGPDQLSPVFAENIGLNVTTVFHGALFMQVSGSSQSPTPWLGYIGFDKPFFYDPSQGNLLMDVINFGPPPFVALDAVDIGGDSVSRVYQDFGAQIPSSGTADTKGLATYFFIEPVPEPSTWALLGMGTVIWAWRYRGSKSKRKAHHVPH